MHRIQIMVLMGVLLTALLSCYSVVAQDKDKLNGPNDPFMLARIRGIVPVKLKHIVKEAGEVDQPPQEAGLSLIQYPTILDNKPAKMHAYLSPDPEDGKKHPMIIWVFGGFSNSISRSAWTQSPVTNDQSAKVFRDKGILMMYPSFRGGVGNPGHKENCYGEVDDLVAAYRYATELDYVDSNRIYLGGHSVGGTMVLLAAQSGIQPRAVFSFGPAAEVNAYGQGYLVYDTTDETMTNLRAAMQWTHLIRSPVFAIEGSQGGKDSQLQLLEKHDDHKAIQTFHVKRADHFTVLRPASALIADKILKDTGEQMNIKITTEELEALFKKPEQNNRNEPATIGAP